MQNKDTNFCSRHGNVVFTIAHYYYSNWYIFLILHKSSETTTEENSSDFNTCVEHLKPFKHLLICLFFLLNLVDLLHPYILVLK